jgi:hypothetical protein
VHGDVIFIDEAYSLYKETTWGDVGSKAVETLLKLMEDNRDGRSLGEIGPHLLLRRIPRWEIRRHARCDGC